MTVRFMCDMETLGTQKGSVVLSISLVPFGYNAPIVIPPFFSTIAFADQAGYGLTVDLETIKWWKVS